MNDRLLYKYSPVGLNGSHNDASQKLLRMTRRMEGRGAIQVPPEYDLSEHGLKAVTPVLLFWSRLSTAGPPWSNEAAIRAVAPGHAPGH